MNTNGYSGLTAIMMSIVPLTGHAASLECKGDVISAGITEQQLLAACGAPTSRNGADWIYARPGSLPVVVTLGDGVVMFIRDAEDELDSPETPLGDHP